MKEKIETIIKNAKEESLLIKTEADYLNIKSKYLGKKKWTNKSYEHYQRHD